MKKKTSYLSQVKFEPTLLNSFQAKYIANFRLVLLLLISIIVLGVASFFQIPRRLNPEIDIPIVTVATVLPGANPSDVESLVTVPLEDEIKGIKGVDTVNSVSRESFSLIAVQFVSTIESEKAKTEVENAVSTVSDLPEEATDPTVKAIDFEDQPIWTFALTHPADTASLMRLGKTLKENLEDNPKIDRVSVSGFDDQEIRVTVDPLKLREYNINPLILSQLIQKSAQSYPAGNIKTSQSSFAFSFDRALVSVEDIRSLRITTQNQTISLSDIATVEEISKPDQGLSFFANNETNKTPAITFFVFKTKTSNIDESESEAQKIVAETLKGKENEFRIVTILNNATDIARQFTDLFGEFRSAVILVFINLFIFLGFRQAVIASLTIPLTFLSAVTIITQLGMSLNFLTLFSFLLALGLLIDDTIVTVAAMTRYYRSGKFTPHETGILVWRDFIVPLWSTTITTIWAFVPLLLSTGIIGEFIKPIPIVVTVTMLSSTSIAVLITIPLMIVALKPVIPSRVMKFLRILLVLVPTAVLLFSLPKNLALPFIILVWFGFLFVLYQTRKVLLKKTTSYFSQFKWYKPITVYASGYFENGILNIELVSHRYMKLIDRILSSKSAMKWTIFVVVIFAVVSYLLVPVGLVGYEFFPKTNEDIVYVGVDMPAGTNQNVTTPHALAILDTLRTTDETEFVTLETGTELGAEFDRTANSASFILTLHLYPKEERKHTSQEIADTLRKQFQNYHKGTVSVRELSGGPPAGADVAITLLGDDFSVLHTFADQIVSFLNTKQGLTNIAKSIKPTPGKIVFVPDSVRISQAGLTNDAIGLAMRSFTSGFTLDTVKFGSDEKDIIFRTEETSLTPEEIGSIPVATPTGFVPLSSLGSFVLEANPVVITRESGKRSISITAGITKNASATTLNQELLAHAQTIKLPAGYEWKTGGVNEENQKSVNSILQAMILSFLLILVTMVIEFGSYRQAAITLLTIPLAIPGVFYIFGLTGTPLSFPSLIGILALFGIVVTNAIVVVEKINDNRKHGMNLHDAIVDASGSRLEPILLTSLTSILGLIPVTLSDPLWRGLGGTIISGLLFSGLIKLFFVPVMYYWWYERDEKGKN